jgi:F-type H+-transporting ATPase subunit b
MRGGCRRVPARLGAAGAVCVAFLLAAPAALPAVEEAHHGEEHAAHAGPPLSLLFYTVNFAIFAYFIVGRGILPSVRRWAFARRDRVITEIAAAQQARDEAERLRAEWAQRVASLEQEIAEIRRLAAADAERERERIIRAAQETAAAIAADARRATAQEVARAQSELRSELARQAVAVAERLIRERTTADDQRRFVHEFLREVSR